MARIASMSTEDLLTCARGEMFGPGNPQLPLPPMLMMDRIVELNDEGGSAGKGSIHAEYDIRPDRWFFECHFQGDPVMPGCLGLDALWQLTGFYLGWIGGTGKGRAIGVGEVKFTGMVTPDVKLLTYKIDIKRLVMRKLKMAVADGIVLADGEQIFEATDMKVGLFGAEG